MAGKADGDPDADPDADGDPDADADQKSLVTGDPSAAQAKV